MKRTLAILILMVSYSTFSMAQMTRGSFMVRGNVGINYNQNQFDAGVLGSAGTYKEYNPTIILSPSVGYFIADNLVLGLKTSYARSRYSYASDNTDVSQSKQITNTYALGLFIRKFVPITDKISFYMEANGSRGWEKPYGKNEDNEKLYFSKTNLLNLNAELGFQYMVTKNIGLDLHTNLIQFSSRNLIDLDRNEKAYTQQSFSIDLNSSIGLGASFFF